MAQATFDIGHITLGDDRLEAAVAIMPVLHWEPGSIEGYEELLTTGRQTIHLVAWMDDEPIGFAFAHTWPGGESDPYLLALLGVAPAHRRKGVGSALFRSYRAAPASSARRASCSRCSRIGPTRSSSSRTAGTQRWAESSSSSWT